MASNAVSSGGDSLPQPLDVTDSPTFDGVTLNDQTTIQPTSLINNPPYLMVFDEASTNLIVNPSFEVNVTDGWSLQGSNSTKTRVTGEKYSGDASMQIVVTPATASSGVVTSSITVSSGTTYIFSLWMKGASGSEPIGIQMVGNVSGAAAVGSYFLTTSWVRQTQSWTSGASDTSVTIRIMTNGVVAQTWYVDACQFEQQSTATGGYAYPTSYLDGSFGKGYAWSGTAHNSTSTRSAGFHVIAPMADNVSNPWVIKPDGSVGSYIRRENLEGALGSGGNPSVARPGWYYSGYLTTATVVGALDSLMRVENTANGCAMWVKSNTTTDAVMIVEGPNATTGGIFQVAAPTSLANFTGSYLRFFDKSNKDMMTVKRDTLTYGNVALGWAKSFVNYGAGIYSETSGSNLTGTVSATASTTLTGSGTSFTTELVIGDVITFTGSTSVGVVEAIASNTSLTLTAAVTVSAVNFQKKAAQVGMFKHVIEGPQGDHVGIGKGDVTATKYLTHADMLRLKAEPYVAGTGTITLTAGSGTVTTGSANAGIAVGDWIHVQGNSTSALGNEPLQVIRVASSTSFRVRPAATTSQAGVTGWSYQKANNMTMPSSNNDGYGVCMSVANDTADAGPSATTNETSIFTTLYRVRAHTLATNRMLKIIAYGTLSGANAGKTLTWRVKLGTTTILTTHAEVIADTSTNNWHMEIIIAANASETSQKTMLNFTCQSPTTSTTDTIIDYETSTVTMSSDQDLDITAQWGVAASTLTCTYRMMEIV